MVLWGAFSVSGGQGGVTFATRRNDQPPSALLAPARGRWLVNVTGAFALGVLDGSAAPTHVVFVSGTGLIGAYTTFSTWMFETQR